MVIFLFGTRVGKYTYEEFQVAWDSFIDKSNVSILVYFKNQSLQTAKFNSDTLNNLTELQQLKNHIAIDCNQVYDSFTTTEELGIKVKNEVYKMILPYLFSPLTKYSLKFNDLLEIYSQIKSEFLLNAREDIIESAISDLHILYDYGKSPLTIDPFYDYCYTILNNTNRGDNIDAVSVMLRCEWDDSPQEKEFWDKNVSATRRGARLERVFVVNRNDAYRTLKNPQVLNHLRDRNDNLLSYVVEREELERENPNLVRQIGSGFLLFKKYALLDKDPQEGKRGQLITDPKEISSLSNAFTKLKQYAVSLQKYLDDIPMSHAKKEMISIFLTTKCNLDCKYCFTNKNESSHKSQTIDYEFVKCGIDDYFSKNYIRHVRFFGAGEPTVEFFLMRQIHDYALKKGGNYVTFEIQTNGAFDDKIAIWLAKNIDIIWISCDGTPEIQDYNRPCLGGGKSSKLIEKNINLLRRSNANFVGIRATITHKNMNNQKEMIDYFIEIGIKHIWVDPIFPSVGEKKVNSEYDMDMMEFSKEFL